MSEKEITHYHMDKTIKYLFLVVFLAAATILGYSFKNKASCNDVVFNTEAKNYRVGEAVVFNDVTPESEKWQWAFGDNTSSFQKAPIHFYEKPGSYDVELIVNGNCVGSKTLEIKEAIKIVDSSKFPVFEIPKTIRVGERLIIDDKSNNASVWEWRFGESSGVDSKRRTAAYTYKEPGLYTVRLIVNNEIDYITKKKITVLEKKEVSIIDKRSRRRNIIKKWNVKDHPKGYKEDKGKDKPKSAPNITENSFRRMLLQVADGTKKASDFKPYFCNDLNKSVVVNKKTMPFILLCQKIANKKIKIKSLELDKEKGTNCINTISILYKKRLL